MGAQDFANEYRGKATIEEAYDELRERALYEHGHSGYTGTIAETNGFILDPGVKEPMTSEDAYKRAHDWDRAMNGEDFPHKWGPAWAIPLLPNPDWVDPHGGRYAVQDGSQSGWLFYGVASC
jgi:hypothetical protein